MIANVGAWLMRQALEGTDIENVIVGCCARLRAAGIPIARGHFAFTVLHPLHRAIGVTWQRGEGTTVQGYPHLPGGVVSDAFTNSPFYHLLENYLDHLRAPISPVAGANQFPILDELAADGFTDYLAFIVGFGEKSKTTHPEGFGMTGSWATDDPSGFNDAEISALLQIEEQLAVACKLAVKQRLMRNVTETYLGRDASAHVLDGQIKRGDGQQLRAAIWYSDMRRSSTLADQLPRQEFIETLNSYFDVTGGAVHAEGGDILSFIGDGLLAIFPTDGTARSARSACRKAYRAAAAARLRLDEVNAERAADKRPIIDYGTALHLGEVMYGNVGVAERLTFSVFGGAINEVARLETLTKKLGMPILMSEAFADAARWDATKLGAYPLRGIGREMEVYAPHADRAPKLAAVR